MIQSLSIIEINQAILIQTNSSNNLTNMITISHSNKKNKAIKWVIVIRSFQLYFRISSSLMRLRIKKIKRRDKLNSKLLRLIPTNNQHRWMNLVVRITLKWIVYSLKIIDIKPTSSLLIKKRIKFNLNKGNKNIKLRQRRILINNIVIKTKNKMDLFNHSWELKSSDTSPQTK